MKAVLSNRNLAWATGALLLVVVAALVRGDARVAALPPLVQLHLASIMVVMALTVPMLLRRKGTPLHRRLGMLWIGLMFANALFTLAFRAGSARVGGVFVGDVSPIHAISLFVAITAPQALLRARRHDVAGHERTIRGLVIGSLLVAGVFTLPFGRTLGTWLFG